MSFQLISNIFSDFSFERDRRMDGRTEPLIEVLWRTEKSSYHISESFPVIFASFEDFQLERYRPTDQPTDRPTDRATQRGTKAHLKTMTKKLEYLFLTDRQTHVATCTSAFVLVKIMTREEHGQISLQRVPNGTNVCKTDRPMDGHLFILFKVVMRRT